MLVVIGDTWVELANAVEASTHLLGLGALASEVTLCQKVSVVAMSVSIG
jgi:hypothetical protein